MALVLGAFVVLFFAITIAKMSDGDAADCSIAQRNRRDRLHRAAARCWRCSGSASPQRAALPHVLPGDRASAARRSARRRAGARRGRSARSSIALRRQCQRRRCRGSSRPSSTSETVAIGARDMAFFTATNTVDQADHRHRDVQRHARRRPANISPRSSASASPQQTLKPGETVRMPVIFFVDPKILDDPDASDVDDDHAQLHLLPGGFRRRRAS